MSPVINKIIIMHFDCSGEKLSHLKERTETRDSLCSPDVRWEYR